jgi:O-acetyl-ADP-ribose deacetylase (regulator of RNase III)
MAKIEFKKGNIVNQPDIEAIVNAANAQLKKGGGVAGAIHKSAGPELEKEAMPLGPIKPGQAVITKAYNLPNKYIIHCLGPVYGIDKPEDKLLAECYKNALQIAEKKNISSIAFPSISTGAFHYPVQKAAPIALKAIKKILPELSNIKIIRFVLFSDRDLEIYKESYENLEH